MTLIRGKLAAIARVHGLLFVLSAGYSGSYAALAQKAERTKLQIYNFQAIL